MVPLPARAPAEASPAEVLAAIGNEVRYRILKRMASGAIGTCCDRIELYENGACVADVVKEIGLAQSTISHHLSILQRAGLIRGEQRGPWTCYFVDHEAIESLLKRLREDLLGESRARCARC